MTGEEDYFSLSKGSINSLMRQGLGGVGGGGQHIRVVLKKDRAVYGVVNQHSARHYALMTYPLEAFPSTPFICPNAW